MPSHVFDPEIIHQCALQAIGKPKPQAFEAFADALDANYPGVIDHNQPWLYSIAGGAMIQMKVYFASIHEYVMIWGTPIGSGGHSGRHLVSFWDTVIDGEAWYYAEEQFERMVFRPGDRVFVGHGEAWGMSFTDGVWAVEYARGFIPASIPFGLADVVFSTLDVLTAAQTVTVYADLVSQHLGRSFKQLAPVLKAASRLARGATVALQPRRGTGQVPGTETIYEERGADAHLPFSAGQTDERRPSA